MGGSLSQYLLAEDPVCTNKTSCTGSFVKMFVADLKRIIEIAGTVSEFDLLKAR